MHAINDLFAYRYDIEKNDALNLSGRVQLITLMTLLKVFPFPPVNVVILYLEKIVDICHINMMYGPLFGINPFITFDIE